MLRKFLPVSSIPRTALSAATVFAPRFIVSSASHTSTTTTSFFLAPTMTLLAGAGGKKKDAKVGFQEKDVPAETLKNPVWDADEDELFGAGELGEDECMLMSEDEWAFFESLQLLSEEELDLLEKDTKAANKKGGKK